MVYRNINGTNMFVRCGRTWFARVTRANLALVALLSSAMACSIDQQGFGFSVDPDKLLQSVETEYQSYNLSIVAPYNTVTLNVRGVSGTGAALDVPVEYRYDSTYVTVSPGGVLTAVKAVTGTPVTATMSYGGSTRVTTMMVSIIQNAPEQLSRLAIEPNPNDSAKVTIGGLSTRITKRLRLIRESDGGTNMSDVLVALRSADTAIARIVQAGDNVTVTPVRPGGVNFYVSTYAYGKGMRDSLSFVVGWPLGAIIASYSRYDSKTRSQILDFKGGSFRVGLGACVAWITNVGDPYDLDIVFDGPSNVASADSAPTVIPNCKAYAQKDTMSNGEFSSGNIPPWRTTSGPDGSWDFFSGSRVRVFRKAGVYRYRSTLNGTTGVLTVCDEKNDRTCAPENYQWGVGNP